MGRMYDICTMRVKRIRTKMFQVWLHPNEFEFLTTYAEEKILYVTTLL